MIIVPSAGSDYDHSIFLSVNDSIYFINTPAPPSGQLSLQRLRFSDSCIAIRCIAFTSVLILFSVRLFSVCQLQYSSHACSSHKIFILFLNQFMF